MDPATHLTHVREYGVRLAAAAATGRGDEPVPGCPGWTLDDLVRHVGAVHQWATGIVETEGEPPQTSYAEIAESAPRDHTALPGWYDDANATLCAALERRDATTPAWTLFTPPDGADFWKRRQAHETLIHCHDAHRAVGHALAVEPELAADGVDELLLFLVERSRRLTSETPVTLGVHATDVDRSWAIRVGPDGRSLADPQTAEATVSGPAVDLDLFLWNRGESPALTTTGDPAVLELWRAKAQIR